METKTDKKDGATAFTSDPEVGKEVYEAEGRNVSSVPEGDAYEAHLENETTHRGLKARHISMIAIGGAVGTGLVIGSGTALPKAGPVGLLLGYTIIGAICFGTMMALGELSTYLPHKRGFAGYATRFVDPAIGFALGWNYLFKYLIVTPNNIVAGVICIQYWDHKKYNPAIWVSIILIAILALNLLGVRVFGEVEFWMSAIKVITLTGLILLGLVLDLGGGPNHDRIGFRYWKNPGPFSHYIYDNATGVFLGVWYAFPNALFAYIGTELVGVTVGEAKNPRKMVPKAIKSTFYRILFFYIGSVIVVGWLVPSNSVELAAANKASANAAASPFVLAIKIAGIKGLPSVINAAIFLFVFSAANSDLYVGTRTLFALSVEGQAPAMFSKVTRRGVPYWSLAVCTAFCGLAYCVCASSALTVFKYFVSLISMAGAITWCCILFSHIRFMKALKVQGFNRDDLPYKAPLQPWCSWTCFVVTIIVAFFKGFDAFMPRFQKISFITNYILVALFIVLYAGYKIVYRTKFVKPEEMDLVTGIREINDNEAELEEEDEIRLQGKNWFMRWWHR